MLRQLNLERVLFLDIETVPQYKTYKEVPERFQKLWDKKAGFLAKNEETPEEIYDRAGIYAEFGKIVCISVGFIHNGEIRLKSFYSHNEKELLQEFIDLLNGFFARQDQLLCAHNGKEFDFPYIARRLLINGLPLPSLLNIAGKKPWEILHLDTMELWKFGDFKNFTSLNLLTAVFDIPTPKDDIDGSMVGDVYYKENDLERIKEYCQKDVVALIQLLRRYRGEELIEEKFIVEAE
ncbi:MAG: 3'-5' exonuclease [Crocinitomicaceae bacterium]|nr:3'-5' exonuclease [Crocinitomicaceae bacterium]|tara:strand:- start:36473 stop:37180 length:708 start_codon:yes stop_codon:yes gene_type:complete